MEERNLNIRFFNSFEDESLAEYDRRSHQSPADRMKEFAILQERCYGEKWTVERLQRVVSYEMVPW